MLDFLHRRAAHWHTVLHLYAYELPLSNELDPADGRLQLRATRPASYGGPPTTIDVREVWRPGRDPQRLMSTVEGHHLLRGAWHLQRGGEGAANAERLDVDRTKPPHLMRHRHPFGSPNEVREQTSIASIEAWMVHVETVLSRSRRAEDDVD